MGYPASDVMDRAAAFLNDAAREVYTYAAQLPYLKTALTDLEQEFALCNVPVTNVTSTVIEVDSGETQITRENVGSPPNYPENLVEVQGVFERLAGTEDGFIEVGKREFIPLGQSGATFPNLGVWSWQEEVIQFLPQGASSDREVKLDYIRSLFSAIANENSVIYVANSINFLSYRTAALCASYIGENPTRSAELNQEARISLDQALGISSKGRQSITTRRRPFMASYKRRRTS